MKSTQPWRVLAACGALAVVLAGCPNLDGDVADASGAVGLGAADNGAADNGAADNGPLDTPAGGDGPASLDGSTGSSDGAVSDTNVMPPASTRIRVVAANLTSGKKQSWNPGHGQRILQGLVPDIVLMQEFNRGDNSAATLAAFVQATCGDGFSYVRETGSAIPNGILSRFPILASGVWEDSLSSNREFVWARIDVPGPTDLWAVSLHLLTSKSSVRAKQITELVAYINKQVPSGDFLIVGGDLNTTSVSEHSLNGFNGLLDRARRPVDQAGNGSTNGPRNKPYDRLFADFDLEPHRIPVVIGKQSFKNGLVFDSRVFTPLIDVTPVMKDDSGATAMQHMAVVRDFALPTP